MIVSTELFNYFTFRNQVYSCIPTFVFSFSDISLWVQTAVQNNEQRLRAGLGPDETQSEVDRTFVDGTLDAGTDDEEEQRLYVSIYLA